MCVCAAGVHIGTSELVFRAASLQQLFWTSVFILAAASMAFGLGTSEYLLVYHTSGLTLSVAGVLKVGMHRYMCTCRELVPHSYTQYEVEEMKGGEEERRVWQMLLVLV